MLSHVHYMVNLWLSEIQASFANSWLSNFFPAHCGLFVKAHCRSSVITSVDHCVIIVATFLPVGLMLVEIILRNTCGLLECFEHQLYIEIYMMFDIEVICSLIWIGLNRTRLTDSPSLSQGQGNTEINKQDWFFFLIEFSVWQACITKEICQIIKKPSSELDWICNQIPYWCWFYGRRITSILLTGCALVRLQCGTLYRFYFLCCCAGASEP